MYSNFHCLSLKQLKAPTSTPSSAVVEFYDIQWKSTHPRGGRFFRLPYIRFRCTFTPVDDVDLFYNIDWYSDGEILVANQTVSPQKNPYGLLEVSYEQQLGTHVCLSKSSVFFTYYCLDCYSNQGKNLLVHITISHM